MSYKEKIKELQDAIIQLEKFDKSDIVKTFRNEIYLSDTVENTIKAFKERIVDFVNLELMETVIISECSDGGWLAYFPLFDCYGDGNTPEEALNNIGEVVSDLCDLYKELSITIGD